MTQPAENDVSALEQAWMEGAFYYGGDAAEQWYFNEGGAEVNPYRVVPPVVPPAEPVAQWLVEAEDGATAYTSEDVAQRVAAGYRGYTLGPDHVRVVAAFARRSPDAAWARIIPPASTAQPTEENPK